MLPLSLSPSLPPSPLPPGHRRYIISQDIRRRWRVFQPGLVQLGSRDVKGRTPVEILVFAVYMHSTPRLYGGTPCGAAVWHHLMLLFCAGAEVRRFHAVCARAPITSWCRARVQPLCLPETTDTLIPSGLAPKSHHSSSSCVGAVTLAGHNAGENDNQILYTTVQS